VKNILCFGDSNTYGLKPDGTGRYDFAVRYPGRLQVILGDEYHVIEEGCPGRTTIFDDKKRPYKKGLDYITPCLLSHNPISYVIVMLGTNDCKSAFRATGKEIASGLSEIIKRIRNATTDATGILIISPIHLGENIWKPGFDFEFDQESAAVSKALATEYRKLAKETDCDFLDASAFVSPSPIDEEHLDEIGHNKLARAVAEILERDCFLEREAEESRLGAIEYRRN